VPLRQQGNSGVVFAGEAAHDHGVRPRRSLALAGALAVVSGTGAAAAARGPLRVERLEWTTAPAFRVRTSAAAHYVAILRSLDDGSIATLQGRTRPHRIMLVRFRVPLVPGRYAIDLVLFRTAADPAPLARTSPVLTLAPD
jgi:hypothetical protein